MGLFDRLFRRGKSKQPPVPPTPPASGPPRSEPPRDPDPTHPPPDWASFFRTGDRYDRFDAALRAYFKAKGQRALVIDGMLRITDAPGVAKSKDGKDPGERTYGLGNVAQVCALEPDEQWPSIIARHFDMMHQVFAQSRDLGGLSFEQARPRLGIRLWDMTVEAVRSQSIWREDIPGLASVLCLDEPQAIRSLRPEDIKHWNKSKEELFDAALANQPALAPVNHRTLDMTEGHTLHEFLGESFFSCAWALRLDDHSEIEGPHGVFFAVPNRHRVIALGFQGPKSLMPLGHFMTIAHGLDHEGPGSISPRVFWKRGCEIIDIPYTFANNALNVSPPESFVEYINALSEDAGGER